MLEVTLTDNDLIGKPAQIILFNMDETGMPLDPNPSFFIAPALVIFDRKFLKPEYILVMRYLVLHNYAIS